MDNSNEIIILKSKINELEKKLCFAEVKVEMQDASLAFNKSASRRRYHSGLDCVYAKRHAILKKLRDLFIKCSETIIIIVLEHTEIKSLLA